MPEVARSSFGWCLVGAIRAGRICASECQTSKLTEAISRAQINRKIFIPKDCDDFSCDVKKKNKDCNYFQNPSSNRKFIASFGLSLPGQITCGEVGLCFQNGQITDKPCSEMYAPIGFCTTM